MDLHEIASFDKVVDLLQGNGFVSNMEEWMGVSDYIIIKVL